MWIRLLRDHLGYRKGSVIEVPDSEGLDLIVAHKAMKAKKGDYMKFLGSPPHDRMMKEPRKAK